MSVFGDQVEAARYRRCQVACVLRRGWYVAIGAHTSRCLLWRMPGSRGFSGGRDGAFELCGSGLCGVVVVPGAKSEINAVRVGPMEWVSSVDCSRVTPGGGGRVVVGNVVVGSAGFEAGFSG